MSTRLSGKTAIITGASSGQGEAAARRFVDEGANVVLADIADEQGESLAKELGECAVFRHLDVANEQDWGGVVDLAVERFGRVDVLVNNAGVVHFSALADTTLEDYQRVIAVNQTGVFLGMKSVVPSMTAVGAGSIINISSVEGLSGMGYLCAYTASKFAVRGMSKCAAVELGKDGIRVNSVHPGFISTPMTTGFTDGLDLSPVEKRIPLRRIGETDDVVGVVAFLASDDSAYCTGAEFVVDGGATATHAFGGM